MTIGIRPSYPNTGYGYIKYDKNDHYDGVHKATTFTEKPSLELAEKFLESGDYLWNAGIFIWRVGDILGAFSTYSPELFKLFSDESDSLNQKAGNYDNALRRIYSFCENVSIDHAIMEKAENVYVIPSSFGWSDLGTWNSAYENLTKDDNANAVAGANAMLFETNNCLINIPDHKLIIAQGLQDYIVVDTHDVILICKKQKEQEIKQYVLDVKEQKGEKFV